MKINEIKEGEFYRTAQGDKFECKFVFGADEVVGILTHSNGMKVQILNALRGDLSNVKPWVEPHPFEKLPVDAKILVRNRGSDSWEKRHFAKYFNGEIFAFLEGQTNFTSEGFFEPWDYAKLAEE